MERPESYISRSTIIGFFLLVNEVAPSSVGAVASNPEFLTQLSLVLAVSNYVRPEFTFPVSKLAMFTILTHSLLSEVSAELCLEPGIDAHAGTSVAKLVIASQVISLIWDFFTKAVKYSFL